MARKKTGAPKMTPAAPVAEDKPVRLLLPPDLHRLLRLIAADEGTSMASYARDAMESHIREEAQRRNIK